MTELEQLSLFEIPSSKNKIQDREEIHIEVQEAPYVEEIVPYEIGDTVRVDPDKLAEKDVLNYNYLLEYLRKKGIVKKVIKNPTLQYEIAYGDKIAFLYHTDLTI
ncbi:hypothetical protein MHH81_21230 [Psychrobacillus sp. FSL H8-0484]|uniref:hypothetical protein n=1 Tax=Psychrobacillus sp. FSL H8-0484 TaxID=2921390 RepID=UPI0030F4BBF5